MIKSTLSILAFAALAACGGGGGDDAPAANKQALAKTPDTAPAPITAPITAPAPAAQQPAPASIAPAAPEPRPVATEPAPQPPVLVCGINQGGAPIPCDPRWPFPNRQPTHGATQAQVDGFNTRCQTARCILFRCQDGRVYPGAIQGACMAPPSSDEQAALNRAQP